MWRGDVVERDAFCGRHKQRLYLGVVEFGIDLGPGHLGRNLAVVERCYCFERRDCCRNLRREYLDERNWWCCELLGVPWRTISSCRGSIILRELRHGPVLGGQHGLLGLCVVRRGAVHFLGMHHVCEHGVRSMP